MPIKYIGANLPQDNKVVNQDNGAVTSASTSSGVVRNIYVSANTVTPTGGSDGDIWIQHV